MGQIVFNNQKPKYCKLQAIRSGGQHVNDSVALNEVWLVDTTNAPKSSTGTGEYDAYIIGDGSLKAGQLPIHYLPKMGDIPTNLSQLTPDTNHQTVSQTEKDLWSTGGSGSITNNVDHEDLTSVEVTQGVNVIKFNDKAYNASTYSGLGKKYLRKNIQTTTDLIGGELAPSDYNGGQYINTNQGVGNVCPMTVGEYESFKYYKTNVKQGDIWTISGLGGNTPRLWALINKTDNRIIAAADANTNSISEPVTLNIENDCILIVNVQNAFPVVTYHSTADTESEKNLLTSAMISSNNTRYVIQYDYDLGGQSITLPQGCVLVFEGGSIRNGLLIGDGASIVADENSKIFDLSLNLAGVWHTQDFYPEWFGAKGDMANDDTAYIQKVLNLPMTQTASSQIGITCHLNNRYRITDSLLINDDVHITGKSNVSLNKSTNTNGTILADFGENWKKWVITSNNRNTTTGILLPFNEYFAHQYKPPYAYEYKGGGVKIDGINIRVTGNAYGGIRLCGLTDSTIDNVAIGGVYVGIHRCTNWYSADSHLHIDAYLCGYACSSENNGHSLSNSYINAISPNKDTEGIIWSKLVFTEETTLYDMNDNAIVLNEGDTIILYSQSMVYVNDSTTPVRIKRGSEFSANWYDENNSTENNPVYVPVTCYVEYNDSDSDNYNKWVLVPWWDYENKYIAPKWQYKKEILLAGMPSSGWDSPSKYIFANKNVGFLQNWGNSVLSNVVMEIWNTALYSGGTSTTVDIAPYRESVDGVYYIGKDNARINVIGTLNGALGNVDGHYRFHAISHAGSRILCSSNSFSAIDCVNNGKVVFENPVISGVGIGGSLIRDRREDEYIVEVGDTDESQFNRTINNALSSSWESIHIPNNYTANFNAENIAIGDKYIYGEGVNTSTININTPLLFYGTKLTFRKLTVNINAPINTRLFYTIKYFVNREINFIGCNVNINGTVLLSSNNTNTKLSFFGNQGAGGASNETGTIVLKDTDSAYSYLFESGNPNINVNTLNNIDLYINHNYVTTSVVDANGDTVTITENNITRNATVYDRLYAEGQRRINVKLLNKLNYGITATRPVLSAVVGGFEYFDTTIKKPIWWNGDEWITWANQTTNYEPKTDVIAYNTAPSTITAQDNKYYRIDAAVGTLAITLPEIADTTTTHTIVFSFSTGATPNVTFISADNSAISYFDGFEIGVETTYEIIAMFNGLKWIISYGVVA